jgi:hypothetical protein
VTTLVSEANRDESAVPEGVGIMAILDSTGDTRHTWDRKNAEEVAQMREIFDSMKAKGYVAYSVKRDGSKDKAIKEFDPDAEKIIFAPRLVGG